MENFGKYVLKCFWCTTSESFKIHIPFNIAKFTSVIDNGQFFSLPLFLKSSKDIFTNSSYTCQMINFPTHSIIKNSIPIIGSFISISILCAFMYNYFSINSLAEPELPVVENYEKKIIHLGVQVASLKNDVSILVDEIKDLKELLNNFVKIQSSVSIPVEWDILSDNTEKL